MIVGAGPSGASLAIRLAETNFRVTLIERERFPRHKLCGEFVSPECFRHFGDLGIREQMISAGGNRILETIFFEPNGRSVSVPSKWFGGDAGGALSLSRARMDFILLEKARRVGVKVLEETAATGVLYRNNEICAVEIREHDWQKSEISADLFVDATGRSGVLAKLVEKEVAREIGIEQAESSRKYKIQSLKSPIQNRLVGFKTHLRRVHLEKDTCEIHFFPGGYGGLSFVEDGIANHCFLVNAATVKKFGGSAEKIVEQVIFQNRRAFQALGDAAPVRDWLAVSVEGFGRKELNPARNLFAVGDAGAFIDPFTGSGMLMAFESAEILAKLIAENQFAPDAIAANYKILHRRKFQSRLRVCSVMRRAAFVPDLAKIVITALSFSGKTRRFLARSTRQSVPANENK